MKSKEQRWGVVWYAGKNNKEIFPRYRSSCFVPQLMDDLSIYKVMDQYSSILRLEHAGTFLVPRRTLRVGM